MIEVRIKNFQSIKQTTLKIDGFAAFTGRSNIGKSALVRAIRCCLTGASGTDFVRHAPDCPRRTHGKKKCKCFASVDLRWSGMRVLWEKGDAVNQYQVWKNGAAEPEVYSAVNRGTPDFLLPVFEPVKVGDKRELIQVAEQFEPIFLLKQGGNTIADVLSDVANLDEINRAMALAVKDRKNAVSTRKIREKDMTLLDQGLKLYEGLDGAVARGADMEARYEAVEAAQERLSELDRYRTTLGRILLSMQALKAATKPLVPDDSLVRVAQSKAIESDDFMQRLRVMVPRIRRLKGVDSIRGLDAEPLRKASEHHEQLSEWIRKLHAIKERVARIAVVQEPAIPEKDCVVISVERLEAADSFLNKRARLQADLEDLTTDLKEVDTQEKAILDEFREMGVCPACSQTITADHCLHLGE